MQQELLYKNVLFVGCSMTDDNLHVIIDQVRKALYVDMDVLRAAFEPPTQPTCRIKLNSPSLTWGLTGPRTLIC